MRLIPISEHPDAARILYDLLAERPPEASISHKKMPTWEEHLAFVAEKTPRLPGHRDKSYEAWYLMQSPDLVDDNDNVIEPGAILGSVYLTKANEIGVFVFKRYQRAMAGITAGPSAVKLLMKKHGPGSFYANVNPANEPSRKMFEKLGFKLVQHTYCLEAE